MNAEAIEAFVHAGPEVHLAIAPGATDSELAPPNHGIGFRLRLPYRDPDLLDICLNGYRLQPDPSDGYESWFANGYTHVQIHVPPEKVAKTSLFVVTCAYAPDVQRQYGWKPPAEVVRRLEKAKRLPSEETDR